MPTLKDLTGKRFGRLTVLRRDTERIAKKRYIYWVCRCDCGVIKSVESMKLKSGRTKSCGCLKRERFYNMSHTEFSDFHNANHRIYKIWNSMNSRCFNQNHKSYKNYGGRGITVCIDWQGESGFFNFLNWSNENGYKEGLSIDRVDVNGGYSPDNCRWITMKEQQYNKSSNRMITYKGETRSFAEWCSILGFTVNTMRHRIDVLGIPFEIAVVMDSIPKAIYKGREMRISTISQIEHVNYKELLRAILVDGEDVEIAVLHLKHN